MALTFAPPDFRLFSPLYSGGPHDLPAGTVKVNANPTDLPVRRRVRLHDQPTGNPVRETWSDAATGAYQFQNLRAGTYFVIAFDHTGVYSAVCESDITLPPPGA